MATAARVADNMQSGDLRHWRARSGYGMVVGDVEAPPTDQLK